MASAFWTLEDGRTFAMRCMTMAHMLDLITGEMRSIQGANDFYVYLERYVCHEENGDIPNGYGGFIRGDDNIMFNFDLREFAPQNRQYFWEAAQNVMNHLLVVNEGQGVLPFFRILLDMHKRINRGEDPMLLNHLRMVLPETNERAGPGW
jgi:hypothetical protein